jgi:hypothetical protein
LFDKKSKSDHKWHLRTPRFKILFHYAGKEEISQRKLQKIRHSYAKERMKQREHLNEEFAILDQLLKHNSIDENTHERLKKLLEIGYEQKREETRREYGFEKCGLVMFRKPMLAFFSESPHAKR